MSLQPPTHKHTPRFIIGQLVMVRSAIDPSRNTDCTRIIDRQWFEGRADWGYYTGWQYVVQDHTDAWAVERSLRPRPEPGSCSLSDLMIHLRKPQVLEPVQEAEFVLED